MFLVLNAISALEEPLYDLLTLYVFKPQGEEIIAKYQDLFRAGRSTT